MDLLATTRLEIQQIYMLLQFVRKNEYKQVCKFTSEGIPALINYGEPRDGESALHLAALEDNDKMATFLLSLDANPNVRDLKGRTPVMRAAQYGHFKTVEVLAKSRANMKILDNDGGDVLSHCLSSGGESNRRCMDILLSFGADPNTTEKSDVPSLVFACTNAVENETMCLMMLERGAHANVFEQELGRSALACACLSGSELVVRALLQAGADPNHLDLKEKPPYHHACKSGNIQACKALAGYLADASIKDSKGHSAIHWAAESNSPLCCMFLFLRGADPTAKNDKGVTPTALAKTAGAKAALKVLKKCEKAFKLQQSKDYKNPYPLSLIKLYDWVFERQEKIKAELLKRVIPEEQLTGLTGSFVWKSEMQEYLMNAEAPFPDKLRERFYNMHDIDRMGIVEIDQFLLGKKYLHKQFLMPAFTVKVKKPKAAKAKKAGKGKPMKGKTKIPVPICKEGEETRRPDGGPPEKYVVKQVLVTDCTRFNRDEKPKHEYEDDSAWYLQKPEKQFVCITEAAKLGDINTVKDAIENGTHVDTRDRYYKTALMVAAGEGNAKLVTYLLSMGASVETMDNFRWTPLHHACQSGQIDVIHMLLASGADGDAQTWNGATPLMRAVQSGKIDVVQFLISCQVNLTLHNKQQKTVVDIAAAWAGSAIYNLVLEKYDQAMKSKGSGGKEGLKIPPLPTKTLLAITPVKVQLRLNKYNMDDKGPVDQAIFRNESRMNLITNTITANTTVAMPTPSSWARQPSSEEVYRQQKDKRTRYGDEVDFENFRMPLKKNFDTIVEKSGK